MIKKTELGQLGENIACEYLVEKNYKIIERNYRQKWGEIDIIAKVPDKTLVFVEVKTVCSVEKLHTENDKHSDVCQISAEDQLTRAKLTKLQRTASLYANHKPELVDDNNGWRIDLLALTLQDSSGSIVSLSNPLTININHFVVKHYENI
ncbi:YraN family protein [Candidatus Wolfebacteria bacterium]|nr:YraN family protein [Candidatus Wolfebacteria bacterium]